MKPQLKRIPDTTQQITIKGISNDLRGRLLALKTKAEAQGFDFDAGLRECLTRFAAQCASQIGSTKAYKNGSVEDHAE